MNPLRTGQFKPKQTHASLNGVVNTSFQTYRTVQNNVKHGNLAHINRGYINDESHLTNGMTMYTRRRPIENINRSINSCDQVPSLKQLESQAKEISDTSVLEVSIRNEEATVQTVDSPEPDQNNITDGISEKIVENIYASVSQNKDPLDKRTITKGSADITEQIEVLSDRAFHGNKRRFDSIAHSITHGPNKTSAYDISNAVDSVYSTSNAQRSTLTNRTSYLQNDVMSVRSMLESTSKVENKFSLSWTPKWIYTLFALCLWTFIVLCIQAVEDNQTYQTCSLSEKIRLWICYWLLVIVTTGIEAYFENSRFVEVAITFIINVLFLLLLHPVPLLCIIEQDAWKTFIILKAAIFLLFAVLLLALWLYKKRKEKD